MLFWSYWIVAFAFLFWLPGISIGMLLLYPVFFVVNALIRMSVEGSRGRELQRTQATQLYSDAPSEEPDQSQDLPKVDPDVSRNNAVEALELQRQIDAQTAESELSSEQSISHHNESLSSQDVDVHATWQDRLEAEAIR